MDVSKSTPEVVVVTGASAGAGRAAARKFAESGARVALLARGRDGLEAAREEAEKSGSKALVVETDVADHEQVEEAARRVEAELGPIDIWVNDAMTTIYSPVKDVAPEDYRRATEVTYLGAVHGTMAALRRMLPRDRGTIVQVGSALSYRSIPLQSAYCGAKHAMRGFTDSLRTELMHEGSGVRVTMPQMPGLNTPQFSINKNHMPYHAQPVPPIYQPEVAADAIVWAAHHPRREMYVGLSTAITILGNKLFPGLGDRYLARNGYAGQQTSKPADPNAPDNLYEPVPGDHGAHGIFDDSSHARSPQLWTVKHRRGLLAGVGAAVGVAAGAAILGGGR